MGELDTGSCSARTAVSAGTGDCTSASRSSSTVGFAVRTGGRSLGGVEGTMALPVAETFSPAGAFGSVLTGEAGVIAGGTCETAADRSGEAVPLDAAGICTNVSTAAWLDVAAATGLEAPPLIINGAGSIATTLDCRF